jgi:hypothetical protein
VGLTIINGNLAVQLRIRAIEEFDIHYVYYGFFETHIKNVDKFGFDLSLEINNEETGKVIHPRVDPVFNYNKERTDAHISADGLFNVGVSNLVNIFVGVFKNLADNYAEEILSFKLNTPTAQAKFFSRLFEDSLNPAATPLVTIANDVTFEGYEEIPFVDMNIARPPIGHSV